MAVEPKRSSKTQEVHVTIFLVINLRACRVCLATRLKRESKIISKLQKGTFLGRGVRRFLVRGFCFKKMC